MIAILGYGSLVWDLADLAPQVVGSWAIAAGPALPVEFSRISPKRKMGLVLCLDPEHGVPCKTHAIVSRRDRVDAAADDLARRERAPSDRIGRVSMRHGQILTRHAPIGARVQAWCQAGGWQGAVWTELEANFAAHTGRAFSISAALAYLQGLRGASLDEAVRYIENAPAETDTDLRRALSGCAWWQSARRSLGP
ncbi:MAG: hypothetical protein AAGC92_10000 [Pseudomonadota bacterium]